MMYVFFSQHKLIQIYYRSRYIKFYSDKSKNVVDAVYVTSQNGIVSTRSIAVYRSLSLIVLCV
jgi:hypothetical protein